MGHCNGLAGAAGSIFNIGAFIVVTGRLGHALLVGTAGIWGYQMAVTD